MYIDFFKKNFFALLELHYLKYSFTFSFRTISSWKM